MDVDRFHRRLEVMKDLQDIIDSKIRTAFWHGCDEAHRRQMARHLEIVVLAIVDRTGLDQKQIAELIDVSPAAICAWKTHGNISLDKRQRLFDFADAIEVELPLFPPARERYRAGILEAMKCLVKHADKGAGCELNAELFEWIWHSPFDCWARVEDKGKGLSRTFELWLQECPTGPHACSAAEIFYRWTPAYIVCRAEFNRKE